MDGKAAEEYLTRGVIREWARPVHLDHMNQRINPEHFDIRAIAENKPYDDDNIEGEENDVDNGLMQIRGGIAEGADIDDNYIAVPQKCLANTKPSTEVCGRIACNQKYLKKNIPKPKSCNHRPFCGRKACAQKYSNKHIPKPNSCDHRLCCCGG